MADQFAVCALLYLVGDKREGHTFHVSVEESSDCMALIRGEDVLMPWLRAACSCGWRAEDFSRFTIEENAHWVWLKHVNKNRVRSSV